MTPDELEDALARGEYHFPRADPPALEETFTSENVEKFILGEATWAQLVGMSMEEAYAIASYGFSLYTEGKYHDARAVFEGLVVCNPYDPYFHSMLGACYQMLDMWDEALEEYAIATDLNPEDVNALVNRGELRLKQGQFSQALADFEKALQGDQSATGPALARAKVLKAAASQALAVLEKLKS